WGAGNLRGRRSMIGTRDLRSSLTCRLRVARTIGPGFGGSHNWLANPGGFAHVVGNDRLRRGRVLRPPVGAALLGGHWSCGLWLDFGLTICRRKLLTRGSSRKKTWVAVVVPETGRIARPVSL